MKSEPIASLVKFFYYEVAFFNTSVVSICQCQLAYVSNVLNDGLSPELTPLLLVMRFLMQMRIAT